MSKNLVLYFSRKGENYCAGAIKSLEKGNTERAAEYIAEAVDGDLFELETVEAYPASYSACTDQAKEELRANARPKLVALPDVSGYDTVFLGYPNWWGTFPMPVATALEALDLAGRRICPFCTNEGSGLGSSERDIERLAAGATVCSGLAVTGHKVEASRAQIMDWAKKLN